jgi:hypothetical protein
MPDRVYLITDRASGERRLVRAHTPAQAVRHAARRRFDCAVASVDDVIALRETPVETAGAEPATESQ